MYGPTTSILIAVLMIVVGLGTRFGLPYLLAQELPTTKDILAIVIFIFGTGVAWATLKSDLKLIRKDIETNDKLTNVRITNGLKLLNMKFASLSKRMDNIEHPKRDRKD